MLQIYIYENNRINANFPHYTFEHAIDLRRNHPFFVKEGHSDTYRVTGNEGLIGQ